MDDLIIKEHFYRPSSTNEIWITAKRYDSDFMITLKDEGEN